MERNPAEEALILLRSRLCNSHDIFSLLSHSSDSNFRKLKFIISSSISEACNNSVLLLGPRGCGKTAVLELVIKDLLIEYPDMISVIKLNGLLHTDDNCAVKEIARQLCLEHQLLFSKMASFDDNSQFMIDMLRECGLAHKTLIFVLDEFDLFAQGKQRLLYSLLDAMHSVTSQAVVIGISCRLDADQLLEKRVRSRFSHRKLLFCPPSKDDLERLLESLLSLPLDSTIPGSYVTQFNTELHMEKTEDEVGRVYWIDREDNERNCARRQETILADEKFKDTIDSLRSSDSTVQQLLRFLFVAVSSMDLKTGILSVDNFKTAYMSINRQLKLDYLKDCSILELYMLVCMKRLETREQNSYNFNSVMKEYKAINDSFQIPDYYARSVCLRAFEHLVERGLICFVDNRGYNQSIEFRSVKLLVSPHELHQALKSNQNCPNILHKLMEQAGKKS